MFLFENYLKRVRIILDIFYIGYFFCRFDIQFLDLMLIVFFYFVKYYYDGSRCLLLWFCYYIFVLVGRSSEWCVEGSNIVIFFYIDIVDFCFGVIDQNYFVEYF